MTDQQIRGSFFFFFTKNLKLWCLWWHVKMSAVKKVLLNLTLKYWLCCYFLESHLVKFYMFIGEILVLYVRSWHRGLKFRWPFPDLWPCLQFATQSRLVCSDVLCMTFTLACSHYTVAFRWGLFVIWNLIYTKEILTGKQNTSNTLHLIMWDFVNYTCRLFVFETCMIHFKGL